MARHICKNAVAAGLAHHIKLELAYVIGVREPIAIDIETDGDRREVMEYVQSFPLTPNGIIDYLDLRRPIYRATSCYGAFGQKGVSWELIKNAASAAGAL
jgi:S-adenosylmethionine synthetase